MLLTSVLVAFIVLFAVVLLSVSVGLKYLESRRKNEVTTMLRTATGEAPPPQTQLLRELKESSNSMVEKLFTELTGELDDRQHGSAGALGDRHGVTDVIAVAVGQQDRAGFNLVG